MGCVTFSSLKFSPTLSGVGGVVGVSPRSSSTRELSLLLRFSRWFLYSLYLRSFKSGLLSIVLGCLSALGRGGGSRSLYSRFSRLFRFRLRSLFRLRSISVRSRSPFGDTFRFGTRSLCNMFLVSRFWVRLRSRFSLSRLSEWSRFMRFCSLIMLRSLIRRSRLRSCWMRSWSKRSAPFRLRLSSRPLFRFCGASRSFWCKLRRRSTLRSPRRSPNDRSVSMEMERWRCE